MPAIIPHHCNLKPFNTFGFDVKADAYFEIKTQQDITMLQGVLMQHPQYFILGGGSNVLFTNDYHGIIIHNKLKGITIVDQTDDNVFVECAAGEQWHTFVLWCVQHGYAGVENLSLIPGTVGAAPIQNIGAYGVELKDVMHQLTALDLRTFTTTVITNAGCKFGYRNSIFKNEAKGQYLILDVTFKLSKKPQFNTTYGAIDAELKKMNVTQLSIKAVSDAVINIRKSKLPDPAVTGNAGSFFKNPEVDEATYLALKNPHENIVAYHLPTNNYKLAAGWLIEQCGFKGAQRGNAGCHKLQALVLVNLGNATGNEIIALATEIENTVFEKFGVTLEREVNVVG